MQKLIAKNSVGLMFALALTMIVGYIDIRTLASSMNSNLSRAVILAELTRTEQLLRTDEIEWVQHMRSQGMTPKE